MSIVVTTRIGEDLTARLDALAEDFDRPRSWIVARAIARFVEEEGALIRAIQEGEADLDAGRSHSHADVEAMFGVSQERRDAA